MRRISGLFCLLAFVLALIPSARAAEPYLVFQPHGKAKGKSIVLISGDEEYRSKELQPQLAKILSTYHGFKCTVLFAIDPKDGTINPDRLDNILDWKRWILPTCWCCRLDFAICPTIR